MAEFIKISLMKTYSKFPKKLQRGADTTRSILSQTLTTDTPWLETWGVCCDSNIWFNFCHFYRMG